MSTSPPVAARRPRDAGFSLVEVLVAMVLFSVMSTGVVSVVTAMTRTSTDSGDRIVAGNLASRELEILRDAFASPTRGPGTIQTGVVTNISPLPGGTAGNPIVVDGVPYTVERDTQWRKVDSSVASSCDEGSNLELAYLEVEVRVSWPALGDRPPVAMHTLMTPQKGSFDDLTVGYIGLRVLDRLGATQRGVRVTATRSGSVTRTTTTGNDGCALFTGMAPGSWTLTVRKDGYVTQQGTTTGTVAATVVAEQFWRGAINYDEATTLEVEICPPAGYELPQQLNGATAAEQLAMTVGNSGLLPSGTKSIYATGTREQRDCSVAGSSGSGSSGSGSGGSADMRETEVRSLGLLWPYASGYQVWPGGCTGNDPQYLLSQTGYTGTQGRDLPVASDPGETTLTQVVLSPVEVRGVGGADAEALKLNTGSVTDNGCSAGQVLRLGTMAGSPLKTSLPPGRWRIRRVGASGAVGFTDVWILKGATGPVVVNL